MRWSVLVALLVLVPGAQAAWQDTVWWGTGLDEDLRFDRNQTAGAADVYTVADYASSADPPDGPEGVSWTFVLEREENETLQLVWGAPLNITAAFSPHTAQVDLQEPQSVQQEVPGASAATLRATISLDGQPVLSTPALEVADDTWQEVTWNMVNPLRTVPADAVVEVTIAAQGPATSYRLGLSEATGWTRLSLPVHIPPPPVIYNHTQAVSEAWKMAWSHTFDNATNRSHVAAWNTSGAAVLDVDVSAATGEAWVAVRDGAGKELFNGTAADRRILTGAPGNWTIEARATGFAGDIAWSLEDLEGPPLDEGRAPPEEAQQQGPTQAPTRGNGTPQNERVPAQPIHDREAPLPWWSLLAVFLLARRR